MKTRIIHTKIWDDSFFINLSKPARYLFFYLITNHRINLCGIYELPERKILFETSFSKEEFNKFRKELEPKIFFYKDWVYVVNSNKLGGYKGRLCEEGIRRELKEIPEYVNKAFSKLKTDTPYIPLQAPYKGQETINKKQETINKKKRVKKFKKPTEEEVIKYFEDNGYKKEIAKKAWKFYEVAKWIDSKGNKIINWKQKMIGVWFKEENKIKIKTYAPHY